MKYFLFIILISLATLNLFAKEIYVNGIIGSDTTKSFDGSTPEKPFRTIQMAVNISESGDIIYIEGLKDSTKIIYNEYIVIPAEKDILQIHGKNKPVISGKNLKSDNNSAIHVLINDIKITGIIFESFLGGELKYFGLKGGAGITLRKSFRDPFIRDCEFRDLNYGIVGYENQSARIDGNTFSKIKKNSDNYLDGGIGIYIYSDGAYIQDNYIGSDIANIFSDIDNYCILIGSDKKLVLGDYSKIQNNNFKDSKGTAIGLFNVEGIFTVTNNTFINTNAAIELKGLSIDISFENNKFNGSSGNTEIITDENFPGDILYSIWKYSKNSFSKPCFAIGESVKKDEILSINGKRYIFNNEEEAIKSAKNNGVIIK